MTQPQKTKGLTAAPAKVGSFFREARDELKKVSWPSRETTIKYTSVIIVSCVAIGLIIGGLDYLLILGIESII